MIFKLRKYAKSSVLLNVLLRGVRIRGTVPLNYGTGSGTYSLLQWLPREKNRIFGSILLALVSVWSTPL